jgi:2-dehydropantoate 2-reductase
MASYPPSSLSLNWTVVGQGAIGLLAACRLQQHSIPVSLHLRQPKSVALSFTADNGQVQQLCFSAAIAPYQAVLVPVKSYDALSAVQQLLPLLSNNAQVVISHNGMGVIEQILPLLLPSQGLWFLTTTHGALKTAAMALCHTGQGQSVLAPLNLAAQHQQAVVSQAMAIALGPVQVVTDIQPYLWQKLVINAVINPLTAIHNCKNGALLKPEYAEVIKQIVLEVSAVSQAAGYALSADETLLRVRQVMQATANNFSSMQQDICHQRRTEINAISGFIVSQGQLYAIPTPRNLQLQHQVLQLQQAYGR